MTSILITGGTGYLGRALTRALLDRDASRICIYSRGEHAQADMRRQFGDDERLRFFIGDVRDEKRLRRAITGCDAVIHAAALKRIEVGQYNPIEMSRTNIDGTINVVDAAIDAGIKKVLYVSTDKAYQPISPYGHSKAMAERIALAGNDLAGPLGTRFAVVRFGNVAGSTGSVIPIWRQCDRDNTCATITDPDCTRFWMARHEAVSLVLNTLDTMLGGEIVIPDLPAYRLGDLFVAIVSTMHPYRFVELPAHEKKHESMDASRCSETARRLSVEELRERLQHV